MDSSTVAIETKPMAEKQAVGITGVWLKSNARGDRIEVLVEVDGRWVAIQEHAIVEAGGIISHCTSPSGIRARMAQQRVSAV